MQPHEINNLYSRINALERNGEQELNGLYHIKGLRWKKTKNQNEPFVADTVVGELCVYKIYDQDTFKGWGFLLQGHGTVSSVVKTAKEAKAQAEKMYVKYLLKALQPAGG